MHAFPLLRVLAKVSLDSALSKSGRLPSIRLFAPSFLTGAPQRLLYADSNPKKNSAKFQLSKLRLFFVYTSERTAFLEDTF